MRVLKLFGLVVCGLLAVVAVAFLLGREGLLFWARQQINSDLDRLRAFARSPGKYESSCVTAFGSSTRSALLGFQLRFTTSTAYLLEAVCAFDTTQPILISSATLPPFVQKQPGSSGILLLLSRQNDGEIVLESFRRRLTLRARTDEQPPEGDSLALEVQYPVSSCSGWGFQCCDPTTEVGAGKVIGNQSSDCPGQCAEICRKRPEVFAFNADPSFNAVTRTVVVASGTEVTFSFLAGDRDGSVDSFSLSFGDGALRQGVYEGGEMGETAKHTYLCSSAVCTYTATLVLKDRDAIRSADLPVTTMKIEVRGQ